MNIVPFYLCIFEYCGKSGGFLLVTVDQAGGPMHVLYVLRVELEKRCQFLHNVSNLLILTPIATKNDLLLHLAKLFISLEFGSATAKQNHAIS